MNVFVTGSASGIGLAIAELFTGRGQRVCGMDLQDSPLRRPLYRHLIGDVRDGLPAELGDVEIFINSAGTLEEGEALDVNLSAAIRLSEALADAPGLRSILFIASASARNGAEFPWYVASKAGLVGYMKNLALRVARRGVTCNSISPGGVITPANRHILEDERLYQAVKDETLLGKWAEPEEVAELAWYLTVQNRSITGEDILMDNGEMLRSNFIW